MATHDVKRRSLGAETVRFVAGAVVRNPASPLVAVIGVVGFGVILQFSGPLNHDVGWLLTATNHLLDGAHVYTDDVIEWNPPLILYLFAPPVGFARITGLAEIPTFRIYITILAGGSLLLCHRLLAVIMAGRRDQLRRYLIAALAYLYLIFVRGDFGQREHLILMLAMPYLLAVAVRARAWPVPPRLAVLAGIGGGLAVSIKPHYAAAWIALEAFLALRRRSVRVCLRTELLVLGAVGALYGISILALTPGYIDVVLPLALDAYWTYQQPIRDIVHGRDGVLIALGLLSLASLRRDDDLKELGWVLFVGCVGFYATALLQSVGWRYVRIPFEASAIWLIALAVIGALSRSGNRGSGSSRSGSRDSDRARGTRFTAAAVTATLLCVSIFAQPQLRKTILSGAAWRSGGTSGLTRKMVEVIDAHASGGSVYFLSVGIAIAFPAVSYSQSDWASRFSCLWPLTAVIRGRGGDERAPRSLTTERIDRLERYLRDAVVEDLERHDPELIFVDLRMNHTLLGSQRLDILAFFRRDPRFETIWSNYRLLVKPLGPYEVFARAPAAEQSAAP